MSVFYSRLVDNQMYIYGKNERKHAECVWKSA